MQRGSAREQNGTGEEPRENRGWRRVVGEVFLLGWVLGVFAYFYQVRGYLALAREVLGI